MSKRTASYSRVCLTIFAVFLLLGLHVEEDERRECNEGLGCAGGSSSSSAPTGVSGTSGRRTQGDTQDGLSFRSTEPALEEGQRISSSRTLAAGSSIVLSLSQLLRMERRSRETACFRSASHAMPPSSASADPPFSQPRAQFNTKPIP